ncbi:MAG: acyl-CoA thioesterase [Chitinophagaceae bacterium]|nr:MAG: acyl-CoA thioesterase [Chitinophagaceae bacterium]
MEIFKTVTESQTTLTELMIPSYANFGGKIHGGIIMSLMDKVAYVCAAKHAGNYCVTASVDDINFLAPVEVGELVSLHASVNHVGRTSMVIGIRVTSQNMRTGKINHTNTSYFTMIAIDEEGKPFQVPGLILKTHEELRRFNQARNRKQLNKFYAEESKKLKTDFEIERTIDSLKDERIRIELS